jgi:uncharacterized OB-fold protein
MDRPMRYTRCTICGYETFGYRESCSKCGGKLEILAIQFWKQTKLR